MAHADNSITKRKLRGSIGKELVYREWDGKTVVAKSPRKSRGDRTSAQLDTQEKFLLASRYSKFITTSADQSLAEAYATVLKPRQNLYSRALEDFLSSPVVKFINTRDYKGGIGDKILVRAMDDFRVPKVWLEIYAADGTLLEEGYAVQNMNGIDWTYTVTQANSLPAGSKVRTIATDVPGNEGTLEVTV